MAAFVHWHKLCSPRVSPLPVTPLAGLPVKYRYPKFRARCWVHGRTQQLRLLYNYSHIKKNEIRLLRGRRNQQGVLYGELKNFHLDSSELPAYHAVSYAWGSRSFKNSIMIDEEQLPVLDSLFPFLVSELDQGIEEWWWVDSLCINQNDDHEKSCQVPLMGQVFRKAERTYVWLGERADYSDEAMEFLEWLGGYFLYTYHSDPHFVGVEELASRNQEMAEEWTAIEKLFQRSW